MAAYSKEAQEEVKEALHEMKEGKLKNWQKQQKGNQPGTCNCGCIVRSAGKRRKSTKPKKGAVKEK